MPCSRLTKDMWLAQSFSVTSVYVYIHISIHIHNYIPQLTIINRGKGAGKIHSISEEISVLDQ